MSDPAALPDAPLIDAFLDHLWLEYGLGRNTLAAYRGDLLQLATFLAARGVTTSTASDVDLLAFLAADATHSARTRARRLSSMRRYYRFLVREDRIERDPSALLQAPRLGRTLPKSLSEADVDALLSAPDVATPLGLRDRAMLEVLYATGLRVSELVALELGEVNLRQGVVRVSGKGDKQRLVPFGEEAQAWLERYLSEARGTLCAGAANTALFPTRRGAAMTRQALAASTTS